jgi:5-formyltetrahydrofolate cyclo-ligase
MGTARDPARTKQQERQAARLRRQSLAAAVPDWSARARPPFERVLAGRTSPFVLAGYHPLAHEADVLGLLAALSERGILTALPCVTAADRPLLFRQWAPGDATVAGRYGIQEPAADQPLLRPDIVLVPLLAFDRVGQRLGQGAGYYDRTLAALRTDGGGLCAVGIAYEGQQAERLPADSWDEKLDWVVTETGAWKTS